MEEVVFFPFTNGQQAVASSPESKTPSESPKPKLTAKEKAMRRCRFGSECRNIDKGCKFNHPPPKFGPKLKKMGVEEGGVGGDVCINVNDAKIKPNPTSTKKKNPPTKSKKDKSKIQCRYGMECRNTKCPFFHHPAVQGPVDSSSSVATNSPRNGMGMECKNTKCPFLGMECRNTKCPFFYKGCNPFIDSPPITNSPSIAKEKGTGTTTTATKAINNLFVDVVMNGVKQHSTPPQTLPSPQVHEDNGDNTSPATTILPPARKTIATTKKKCRWGAGCRNKKCSFLHPGQKYDKEAAAAAVSAATSSSPKRKTNAGITDDNKVDLNHQPKSMSSILPELIARATSANNNMAPTHSILPPSPPQDNPPDSTTSALSYPPGILFPYPESEAKAPTPQPSPAAASTQSSSSNNTMFNLFNSVFNNGGGGVATSDFAAGGTVDDDARTPLYNKISTSTTNAFRNSSEPPLAYHQPTTEGANRENNEQDNNIPPSPDTDFLFELLGISQQSTTAQFTSENQQKSSVIDGIESIIEDENMNTYGNNTNTVISGGNAYGNKNTRYADFNGNSTPAEEQVQSNNSAEVEEFHDCIDTPDNYEVNINGVPERKKLISEDEITQSRRAALELRLEAQQNSNNPETLYALLQTCRSKQDYIKTALEQAMEGGGAVGNSDNGTDIDETNLVALLDLNELLVGAITMAESSLRITEANGKGNGARKKATKAQNPVNGISKNAKNGDLEKKASVVTTSAAAKTTVKKNKQPSEIAPKPNHPSKKTSTVSFASEPSIKTKPEPIIVHHETVDVAQREKEEKEKMARMLEEARKQSAAAKERKKSKKDKKFDRWLKQNQEARESRAKTWSERIAKENDYIDLIEKLLVAEFLRQSKNKTMGLTAERVLADPHAFEAITKACRDAYNAIFGGNKCRIQVAGSESKDLNGRQGSIRYWDKEKEKFSVGLDTKKSQESDVQFLLPEVLDVLASSRQSSKADKKSSTSYDVDIPDSISSGGVSLGFCFTLHKSHVYTLGSSESMKQGLELFCKSRDEDERRERLEEEAERKREVEDRKRRAARKAQENAAWEKRKEQMRRDKEEYEQMKREWAKERSEKGKYNYDDDDDDDDEECQCPRCRFGDKFSTKGGAFFFNIGGIPFKVRFDSYDSDEESFFDEDFDDRWEEQLEEERIEENRKQAKILGEYSALLLYDFNFQFPWRFLSW